MWLRRKRNWRDSEAHLLLLTKFLDGESIDRYSDSEEWTSVLGENPKKAVERLIDESMLQPASLARLLHHTFTATELRTMLRQMGIKVAGRKAEIIERLIESDAAAMQSITKSATVYECTVRGTQLAQEYPTKQQDCRRDTEQNTLALLVEKNVVEAVRVMVHYESIQVFPRGNGVDWENYDCKSAAESLRVIFQERPGILNGMKTNRLEELRIAAGMIHLWGVSNAKPWLSADFETGVHFDANVAARMLCSYAVNLERLKGFEDPDLVGFVTGVEISAINDGRTCQECSQIDKNRYKFGQTPELPLTKCTSEMGCRCLVVPITVVDEN